MYNSKQILYIVSALAASEKAMCYAEKYDSASVFFDASNQVYFNGTLTLLIALGEEVKKIDNELLKTQPTIDWQKLKDMRNFLAHDYRGVDYDIVFDVVKVKLPTLSQAFIAFLQFFPKVEVEEVLQNKYYHHLRNRIYNNQ
ncbi:MAG: DUF86 domain-containing protein [Bacteroidetes bacterium]|nr:MAG: DUF86 domain-containing protein [Bacteroidota bacterium]TAE69863.1 MAG: DUF86 domain-containing protein [Bacteroidota bacterium]TAF92566.1 MAG: DUF86 domain-containing protein [Bacteroidota bacterium]